MFDTPKFLKTADARIAYYEQGAGEPLVLLHGNGEDSTYFRRQIGIFAKRFRVIAMDSRGHGRSEHGTRGLSFALMADDLKALLEHLGISRAHVLGFSDGGNLSLLFALRYPQCVDKLILNGANVELLRGVKPYVQLPLYPVVGLLSLWGRFDEGARHKRDVLALMTKPYGVTMNDLPRITAPTLVIAGEHDLILECHTRAITAALPDSRLVILPGGDHFCAAGLPHQYNLAVLRFLLDR